MTGATQLPVRITTCGAPVTCLTCRQFVGAADEIETGLPGLRALSSVHASVRSADGLCRLHDRYLAASSSCLSHEPVAAV